MKKFAAVITVIAVILVAMMLLSLAGCSAGDSKELRMGTNATFPPYEYYEGEEIVGIDAEIAAKIAEKLGKTLVIEDMEFSSIIAAVQSGKIDMGMAGMTIDEERLQSVNFTTPYAEGHQVIIVKEDSTITGPDDLAEKKIGVQESTTGDIFCTGDYGDEWVERYNKGTEAVLALTQGKIDAVVIDREPAKVFVEENPGLKILDTEYAVEEYAIAIAKDNDELLNDINTALEELIADGTVQSILDKYITAE